MIKITSNSLIDFQHVSKVFNLHNKNENQVLKDVNFSIKEGDIFGVIGYSGAGKSTLIRCINGIEKPSNGKVIFNDKDVGSLENKQVRNIRHNLGMIFQQFNLLPGKTIAENVALPIKYSKTSKNDIKKRVQKMLQLVELPEKANDYPSSLSGGQQQRVAIARALINNPKVLLCDEATSALDPKTTQSILHLLYKLNREHNITIIIVTHEMNVIEDICDKVAVLNDGSIVEKGDVYSTFSNPKKSLTQEFIDTTSKLNVSRRLLDAIHLEDGQKLIKITYIKGKTINPLISFISRHFNVDANIIIGDIKLLQEKLLGGLIVILNGQNDQVNKAFQYLKDQDNIRLEELNNE